MSKGDWLGFCESSAGEYPGFVVFRKMKNVKGDAKLLALRLEGKREE